MCAILPKISDQLPETHLVFSFGLISVFKWLSMYPPASLALHCLFKLNLKKII